MTRFLNARRRLVALLAATPLVLAGCLGNSGGGGGNAQLRVLNLTNDLASIDVSLNGSTTYSAVASGTLSGSSSVGTQSYTVGVASAGTPTSLFSSSFSLSADKHYTGVVWGSADSLKFATLPEDENDSLSTGSSDVRVYNATTNAGNFDVYLTPSSTNVTDLSTVSPTRSNVASAGLSGYATLSTGSYRLRITAAGNPNDVRLDVPSVTLGDVEYATVIITAGQGNTLVNATVIVQQKEGLTAFNNGQSRVRVVASVQLAADGTRSVVAVMVDGTALASGTQTSPNVGQYTPLTAGNHVVDVSVNGTPVSSTTQAFTAGGDYTLMTYGPLASPQTTLIADNNSVPALGRVKLRLINGDDTAGPVTMLVDSGNVYIPDITPGGASDYALYNATSTTIPTSIEIDSQSSSTFGPLYLNDNQNLLSQGVYTVFLLRGGKSTSTGLEAPTGLLRKDR